MAIPRPRVSPYPLTPYNQHNDKKSVKSGSRRLKKFFATRTSLFAKQTEKVRYFFRSLPRRIKQLSAPKARPEDYLPDIIERNGLPYFKAKGQKFWLPY